MKESWEVAPLERIAHVDYGTRVVRSKDEGTKFPVYGGGGPTFMVDQVNRDTCLVVSRFGMSPECVRFVEGQFFLNDSGLTVRSRQPEKVLQSFLDAQIAARSDEIFSLGKGSAQRNLDVPAFRKMQIAIPGAMEQKQIVAVLDEAFDGLDQAQSNVTANLRDTREVFSSATQQLLSNDPTTKLHRLGSVVDRLTNGYVGPTRGIYLDVGVPYLLARHVRDNVLTFDGRTFVSQQFNEKHRKSKLKAGDVLLVQSGHIGHCAVVTKGHEGHNCHAMIVLTPKPGVISGQYMSALFNTPVMQAKFQEIRTGSTVPHLTCGMVKELMIPVPNMERQDSLLNAFSAFERETKEAADRYLAELADLKKLRSVLLESAFSGELT